jgi:hypothetical protein
VRPDCGRFCPRPPLDFHEQRTRVATAVFSADVGNVFICRRSISVAPQAVHEQVQSKSFYSNVVTAYDGYANVELSI